MGSTESSPTFAGSTESCPTNIAGSTESRRTGKTPGLRHRVHTYTRVAVLAGNSTLTVASAGLAALLLISKS